MRSGRWSIAYASAIGTSHIKHGTACQDFALSRAIHAPGGEEILAAVVCDGAGSALHSDVGSRLAAEWFLEHVEAYFENSGELQDISRTTMLTWMAEVRDALMKHAEEFGRQPRDYSCTLLAAIVGEQAAAFAQVGDGAMVVSHGPDDGWSYVFWPQHGEFANTTNFLMSANLPETVLFSVELRAIDEVAVFSDGIENLVLHQATRTVYEPFFETMFQPLRGSGEVGVDKKLCGHLARYLGSKAICDKTDDDKTLAMATRCKPV